MEDKDSQNLIESRSISDIKLSEPDVKLPAPKSTPSTFRANVIKKIPLVIRSTISQEK